MSGAEHERGEHGLSHHPAPKAEVMPTWRAWVLLFTGPSVWFLQFCIGVPLANWPCYPADTRLFSPAEGYGWTRAAILLLLALCALAAGGAAYASWRKLQEVSAEKEGGHQELAEIGHGRTRFIALWGVCLGIGFTAATLFTFVGFALVPRCAG